ncbi:beta-1,3-galactosyltransferase brn-like [Stegodyphus dumicola]|uniref:beta-1,3-galactosyltransferase brn-like n=1 Tax=Stegodyphus dumicola TaxID=202533 RepID=UPI0015B0C922|nr:beta-1,3-galactosyltransferase brn-like [Stegodyphus dumicola]XP_035223545.1 beta-1,3-galactosyltransferase brn-like [Stegodyphus dumicola]XP_035223546.1 beta-1,3-galactosyltransferase brn-like [Stegodyphus dumicola]
MHILPSYFGRFIYMKSKIKYLILACIIIFVVDYFGLLLHLLEIDYSRFTYPLDISMEETLAEIRRNNKFLYHPINEYNYNYKIKNEQKCLQLKHDKYDDVLILYIIKSALLNQRRRDGIRKTWGWENRFSDVTIRRIFMLGVSEDKVIQDEIDEEYVRFKDIQADFLDTYYNNTIKTMLAFKWVIHNCPRAQFIVFADDDMYISTKNLLKFIRNPFNKRVGFRRRRNVLDKFLQNMTQSDRLITLDLLHRSRNINKNFTFRKMFELDPVLSAFDGRLFAGYVFSSSPMRHKSSKWFVTLAEYPYSKYPPYVTAGTYVLSYPALEDMYYTSLFTKHFKFDDVYLGIIAKKCNIVPLHNEHFYFWRKPYSKNAYANVVASHGFSDPEELKQIWEEQRSLGHA